nr:Ig-like domain-containing protein [Acidobacteriota bacterium]
MKRFWFACTSLVFYLLTGPVAAQDPAVAITFDQGTTYTSAPGATISGSISPLDAALTMNGATLTVNPDGTFSQVVTLLPGINAYLFRGVKDTYTDAVGKYEIILDDEAPELRITGPADGLKTNRDTIDIHGVLFDDHDSTPTLSRSGAPISLTGNRFAEADLPLAEGENSFTYDFQDAAGNAGQLAVTVYRKTTLPTIAHTLPTIIDKGASYNVSYSFGPVEDLAEVNIYVDGNRVYSGSDAVFSQNFTHTGDSRDIPVSATVRDVYGNTDRHQASIAVAHRHYLFGAVLDDETSQPLSGVTVTITTPKGPITTTTDSQGGYSAYVMGHPVTVTVDDPARLPVRRTYTEAVDARRIPDLRLTARDAAQSVASPFTKDNDLEITLQSGFSGSASVTAFQGQGLPVLLPLGWSPVVGFEVSGATGTGTVAFNAARLPLLQSNRNVVLLKQENDGWTVTGVVTSGAFSLQGTFTATGNGLYLAAVRDPWLTGALPLAGDVLARTEDAVIAAGDMSSATTFPAEVSIIEDPQTHYFLYVNSDGSVLSGSRARVLTSEQIERIDGDVDARNYTLDIHCYNYGTALQHADSRIGGQLAVKARGPVTTDLTRYGRILFDAAEGDRFQASLLTNLTHRVGGLTLDFTGTQAGATAASLESAPPADIVLPPNAEVLTAFNLWLGGNLTGTPSLQLAAEGFAAVILVQKDGETRRRFLDSLQYDGTNWTNDTSLDVLRESGVYALVGLKDPITLISGTVNDGAVPAAGVRLSSNNHPYTAVSGSTGAYLFFDYQIDTTPTDVAPTTLAALEPTSRRTASLELPATAGVASLINQDLVLTDPDFQLTQHTPQAAEQFVARLPQIVLDFSLPVTEDQGNLDASIDLVSSGATEIPLQILADLNRTRLNILPLRSLAPDTEYTLTVSTSLQSLYGNPFTQQQSVTFRTRIDGVAGNVDLTRFYLSWENDSLYINGPADAFPNRTWLSLVNEDTPYTWKGTITNTVAFKEDIVGNVGDAIYLDAILPDGTRVSHRLEVVFLGDNDYLMGTTPFSIDITPTARLNVKEVNNGVNSTVTITEYQAAAKADMFDIPALSDGPDTTTLQAFSLRTQDGSALPDLEGSITFQLGAPLQENEAYHLVGLVKGLMAPSEPGGTDLVAHDVPFFMDSIKVTNGEIVDATGKRRGKVTIGGDRYSFMLQYGGMRGIINDSIDVAVVQTGVDANYGLPIRNVMRSLRENWGESPWAPIIDAIPINRSFWHGTLPGAYLPVPSAPVYRIIDSFPPKYIYLGVTDGGGQTLVETFGPLGAARGVDPVTGQVRSFATKANHMEYVVNREGNSAVSQVIFNPNAHAVETLGPQPPRLTVKTAVGLMVDNQFMVDENRTRDFHQRRMFTAGSDVAMQFEIESSEKLFYDNCTATATGVPEVDIQFKPSSMIVTVPAGFMAAEQLMTVAVTVVGENGQQGTVKESFMVLTGSSPSQRPGKPLLLSVTPTNGQKDVYMDQPIQLTFSEPVKGLAGNNVTLTYEDASRSGSVALEMYSHLGDPVGSQDLVTEVYARPNPSLRFGRKYTITVQNLTDSDPTPQTIETSKSVFHTATVEKPDFFDNNYRSSVAFYRNLALTVDQTTGLGLGAIPYAQARLYDVRRPFSPMELLATFDLKGLRGARFQFELFFPWELNATLPPSSKEEGNLAVTDLPVGTVLAVVASSLTGGANSQIYFYYYKGGGFVKGSGIPISERGGPRATAKLGPYLFAGFFDAVKDLNTAYVPRGSVRVYDIARVLEVFRNLAPDDVAVGIQETETGGDLNVDLSLEYAGMVAQYPVPGDCYDLETFFRRTETGIAPGFLNASLMRPAIYTFDPEVQPPALGMAMGGLTDLDDEGRVRYDERLLIQTEYPSGTSFGGKATGAVEGLTWLDSRAQTPTLKQADFAVFSDNYGRTGAIGTGYLYIYQLPKSEKPLPFSYREPDIALQFNAGGIRDIATDKSTGMIAISDKLGYLHILDLRHLLENHTPAFDNAGYDHPSFILKEFRIGKTSWLVFHEGTIWAGIMDGNGKMMRVPVVPKSYSVRGFNVLDMNHWALGTPAKKRGAGKRGKTGDEETLIPEDSAFHSQSVVLFATDLVHSDLPPDDNLLPFVIEQASFEIEAEGNGAIEVSFFELDELNTDVPSGEDPTTYIPPTRGPGRSIGNPITIEKVRDGKHYFFSTEQVRLHFNDSANRARLREKGYLPFELRWKLIRDPEDPSRNIRGSNAFVVAYRSPPTRYEDPQRIQSGVDLVTRHPYHTAADIELNSEDARLNLSAGRVYHDGYRFQFGPYGFGMMDTQMPVMGFPVWFQTAQTNNELKAHPRILFEHPGQFELIGELARDAQGEATGKVNIINDPASFMGKDDSRWTVIHKLNMTYNLSARGEIPDYAEILKRVKKLEETDPEMKDKAEKEKRLHRKYPLMRFHLSKDAPPSLYRQMAVRDLVKRPWQNKLSFLDDQGSSVMPTQIKEHPADVAEPRIMLREWTTGKVPLVAKNIHPHGLVEAVYTYDEDNYLTRVTLNPKVGGGDPRTIDYIWSELPFKLGDVKLKRLKEISYGGQLFTKYAYNGSENMTLASIDHGYGPQSIQPGELVSGMAPSVTLGGVGGTPNRTVTFGLENQETWLSKSVATGAKIMYQAWQPVPEVGPKTYMVKSLGRTPPDPPAGKTGAGDWKETFTYDDFGRMSEHTRFDVLEKWTYDTTLDIPGDGSLPDLTGLDFFWNPATYQAPPVGGAAPVIYTMTTNKNGVTTTNNHDGKVLQTWFSKSGIPVKSRGIDGRVSGASDTDYYGAAGGSYRNVNGLPTQFPIPGKIMEPAAAGAALKGLLDAAASGSGGGSSGGGSNATEPPTPFVAVGASVTHNAFGQPVEVMDQGLVTKYTYDAAGRVASIVRPDGTSVDMTYAFGNGFLTVTSTMGSASTVEKYDAAGNLTKKESNLFGRALTVTNTFDDLGRLLTSTAGGITDTYAWYGDTSMPTSTTVNGVTTTYTPVDDFSPRITGMTTTAGSLTKTLPTKTNRLGQVTQNMVPGVGLVDFDYDHWGRLTSVKKAAAAKSGAGAALVTYSYPDDLPVVIAKDHVSGLVSAQGSLDPGGLFPISGQAGSGMETAAYVTAAEQKTVGSGMFAYDQTLDILGGNESNAGKIQTIRTTASPMGNLGGQIGTYSNIASSFDNMNRPTAFTKSGSVTYGPMGELVRGVTRAGESFEVNQRDAFGRVEAFTDNRGGTHTAEYHGSGGLRSLSVAGDGVTAKPTEQTQFDYASSTTSTHLGQKTQIQHTRNNTVNKTTITEVGPTPKQSGSTTIERDPDTGLITKITDPDGVVHTQVTYDAYGRPSGDIKIFHKEVNVTWNGQSVTITPKAPEPTAKTANEDPEPPTTLTFDSMGRVVRAQRGSRVSSVQRDIYGRITAFLDGQTGETVNMVYDQENLTAIEGEDHKITFSNINSDGQPGKIEIKKTGSGGAKTGGDTVLATIENTYDASDPTRLKTSKVTDDKGFSEETEYDSFGNVSKLKKPYDAANTYAHDYWDWPSAGPDGNLGDRKEWNLQNGIMVKSDNKGRLSYFAVGDFFKINYNHD